MTAPTQAPAPCSSPLQRGGRVGRDRQAARGRLEYTAPCVIIEGAYLVRNNAPLQRNEDVDRTGTRVAVGHGSAYDLYLTRALKSATGGARADLAGCHRPVPGAEPGSRRRREAAAGG